MERILHGLNISGGSHEANGSSEDVLVHLVLLLVPGGIDKESFPRQHGVVAERMPLAPTIVDDCKDV